MASIISYSPSGLIEIGLFNDLQAFGTSNYKLSGSVSVSVSDSFTSGDYALSKGSLSSSVYTSSVSGNANWNATQLSNIQNILNTYSSFININFSSFTNFSGHSPSDVSAATDIDISLINRPDLSFAGLSASGTDAYGYKGSALDIVIDSSNLGSSDTSLSNSSYGGFALMHEIGHSLGLSHPFFGNGGADTPNFAAILGAGFDRLGFVLSGVANLDQPYFSMMSYKQNSVGTYAVTPMILDVIALQNAYGEGTGSNGTSNDVITPGSNGAVDSYRTYFDTGGNDTINLQNYSGGSYIHLGTSIASSNNLIGVCMSKSDYSRMISGLSPNSLRWLDGNFENATGSAAADRIIGSDLNNTITPGGGNDYINGNGGVDIICESGSRNQYSVTKSNSVLIVTDSIANRDGADTLENIERLQFSDRKVAYDVSGDAGEAYRIYKAALGRAPDAQGLGDWIRSLDAGDSLETHVAAGFTNSAEFIQKYGAHPTDTQFITLLYQNVLGRAPDAPGLKNWQDALNSGSSREHVLVGFSESQENIQNTAPLTNNGIEYI